MQRKSRKLKPIKLLRGLLDLLVLQALGNRRLRTRAIARRIHEITNETFLVETASLVPSLKRLKDEKCIYRDEVTKDKVVYHFLTVKGRQRLKAERRRWDRIRDGVEAATNTPLGMEGDSDFYRRVPTVLHRRMAYRDIDFPAD